MTRLNILDNKITCTTDFLLWLFQNQNITLLTYSNKKAYNQQQGKMITGPTREVYLNDPHEVEEEDILTEIYAPIAWAVYIFIAGIHTIVLLSMKDSGYL